MTYAPPVAGDVPGALSRPSSPRWWQRPWIVPLAAVAVVFVAFSLPPYLSLDPARSRVPAFVAEWWLETHGGRSPVPAPV